ncbi:hypothetical protein TorRG33x02_321900 [Trema orientale]|uniref:Uncharacterized protein n=1 Tax=Trema orientale TaxID=63057 RepID=A0A2P5BGK2_TREOI|nr:hypothetical protein TorRG33x02_321900 [Trema orientale]
MDLDHILQLCEHLCLDEEDGPIMELNKESLNVGKDCLALSLVGKIIGNRPANCEGLENNMKAIWRINHRIRVEDLGNNNFTLGARQIEIGFLREDHACMTEECAREWGAVIGPVDKRIGHKALECPIKNDEEGTLSIDRMGRFGAWLRALSLTRICDRKGKSVVMVPTGLRKENS